MGVDANCCRRPQTTGKKDLKIYRGSQKKGQNFLIVLTIKKIIFELFIQKKLSKQMTISIQYMKIIMLFQIIIISNIHHII
jgi:hypothetical protein